MSLELQFKLRSNPLYIQYLHSHSYWYKYLNRNPKTFSLFLDEVKEAYHLRMVDKINKTIDTIDMITTIINTLSS